MPRLHRRGPSPLRVRVASRSLSGVLDRAQLTQLLTDCFEGAPEDYILDQLMAKAEECRAAALEYAMAPFRTRAQKGEDSGKPDSLQERWDEVWTAEGGVAEYRHSESRKDSSGESLRNP